MLPEDLPGPLYDGVVTYWTETARVADNRDKKIKDKSKRSGTPGMTPF
jgi:hypothetical protein